MELKPGKHTAATSMSDRTCASAAPVYYFAKQGACSIKSVDAGRLVCRRELNRPLAAIERLTHEGKAYICVNTAHFARAELERLLANQESRLLWPYSVFILENGIRDEHPLYYALFPSKPGATIRP